MGSKKFKDYARDKYQVDYTQVEAQEARNQFFSTYTGLQPWHQRQRLLVHKFGFVRSPIGRKRRLPEIESTDQGTMAEAERQSINSPVQGFGSDLDVISLIRISNTISHEWCRPVGTIHDAILIEVRIDKLHEVAPVVVDIMKDNEYIEREFDCDPFTVPLEVELSVGAWGKGETVYDDKKGFMMDKVKEIQKRMSA